jgi:hypothetical protein
MRSVLFACAVGTFGAILQELLFWYNAKTKLGTDEYRNILHSPGYWIISILMAIGSGIASYLWFRPSIEEARTYVLFGAAFPVLFKKAVDAFVPAQTTLGGGKPVNPIKSYFRSA